MKHTIWQNYNINLDDWNDFLEEVYPDVTDEYDRYQIVYDIIYSYLDDERINLDKYLDNRIVAIANLGLWYGRREGYAVVGTNIKNCLEFCNDCMYAEWYVNDDGDLCSRQSHHDGTNHYTYRVFKDGAEDEIEYMDRIPTNEELLEMTEPIGYYVADVYGWNME